MKISIITVSFNAEKSIAETLISVANQTYKNIEHILIDGASSDETLSRVKEYGQHLSKLISEPDCGIYDAMNKGLEFATGDIFCFLNADDKYSHENVLQQVAQKMSDYGVDALFGDVSYFHPGNPQHAVRRYRSNLFTPDRLAWGWMPAHPALFLSRAVVRRVGSFKTDYRIAGDYEYILRVFHGHEVHYYHLPEILVNMQIGGISTSGLSSKILLNREVLRACRENGLQTNIVKILSKYPAKILELLHR